MSTLKENTKAQKTTSLVFFLVSFYMINVYTIHKNWRKQPQREKGLLI